MDSVQRERLSVQTERWFVRRGVPHLIADYSATADIWTRAAPFLAFVLFAELFLTFGDEYRGWGQAAVFIAGVAFIVTTIAVVNRLRGRRAMSLPNDIGPLELAAFVLVPAVLPAVVNNDAVLDSLVATVAFNLAVLVVTYITVSYGLVPLIGWSIARFFKELSGLVDLLAKSLPLLLLFSAFLVLNAEMWQVAHDLPPLFFALIVSLMVLLGSAFVGISLRRSNPTDSQFTSWDEVLRCCTDSPLADMPLPADNRPIDPPPLDRATRRNISLMLFVGIAIQVLLVALLISAFYIIFGLLTGREATIVQWIADETLDRSQDLWWSTNLGGAEIILTRAHVVVAGFIGAFSGLQFAVSVLTDATYREEFAADVADEVRENLAVRALYHETLVRLDPPV
jgi:hypothetical protein